MRETILTINNINKGEKGRNIFFMLSGFALVCITLYIYFMSGATLNLVQWKNLQANMSVESVSISNLESEYISMKNGIDLEYAHSLGFEDAKEISYITKKTLGKI